MPSIATATSPSLTQLGEDPYATDLVGRMMVIVKSPHDDFVVQGVISGIFVYPKKPKTLCVKLGGMMRWVPESAADSSKGCWQYLAKASRVYHLKYRGKHFTNVTLDPVSGDIIIALTYKVFIARITSPSTKHPEPEDILSAKLPQ